MVDRYTYYVLQFLEGVKPNSRATIDEMVSLYCLFFACFHNNNNICLKCYVSNSIFNYSSSTPHPGWSNLLPVQEQTYFEETTKRYFVDRQDEICM